MPIHFTIASDTELRLTLNDDTGNKQTSQKIITDSDVANDLAFSYKWLLVIGSYLFRSPELRTLCPEEVDILGQILYGSERDPPRFLVVFGIVCVTKQWASACLDSKTCIAAPTLSMTKDPALNKIIGSYQSVQKDEVAYFKTVAAINSKYNNEPTETDLSEFGITGYTPGEGFQADFIAKNPAASSVEW